MYVRLMYTLAKRVQAKASASSLGRRPSVDVVPATSVYSIG